MHIYCYHSISHTIFNSLDLAISEKIMNKNAKKGDDSKTNVNEKAEWYPQKIYLLKKSSKSIKDKLQNRGWLHVPRKIKMINSRLIVLEQWEVSNFIFLCLKHFFLYFFNFFFGIFKIITRNQINKVNVYWHFHTLSYTFTHIYQKHILIVYSKIKVQKYFSINFNILHDLIDKFL